MSFCRGSAGNDILPVPLNFQVDGCVMSSSTRLASTGFLSQPASAEFARLIGISARGVCATTELADSTNTVNREGRFIG